MNNLKNVKLDNYTPEFLCSFLDVDAIIYIYIHSDLLMPLKNCFTQELIADISLLDEELLLNLDTDNDGLYTTLPVLKNPKFKNKKIYVFTSIYDKSGDLIWLHSQDYEAYDVWNTIILNYKNVHNKSLSNIFFDKSLRFFLI